MKNEPLNSMSRYSAEWYAKSNEKYADLMKTVLAAEAFWREQVRKVPEFEGAAGRWAICSFCRATGEHKPDCAWKLSQVE